jgi:hypothetical protein
VMSEYNLYCVVVAIRTLLDLLLTFWQPKK